jgi:hypothetical protein
VGQVDEQAPASKFNGNVGDLIHKAETQLRRLKPEAGSRTDGASNLSSVYPADFRGLFNAGF